MKSLLLGTTFITYFVSFSFCQSDCMVSSLICDGRSNPMAIVSESPRLSWQIESATRNQMQSAYQVLVADDGLKLNDNQGNVWNSRKVESSNAHLITYGGTPLEPGKTYYWKVRIWNKAGQVSAWSRRASWTTGLSHEADWSAKWTAAYFDNNDTINRYAALQFRKERMLNQKPIKAIASLSGLGYSELYINGKKIGNDLMNPSWTDYTKRVMYNTFDVTSSFNKGTNAIGVLLGNGWYNLATPDLFAYEKSPWTDKPKFLLNITLIYGDGSREVIVSDESWRWRKSQITFNCIRGGETIDARLVLPDWDKPGFDDRHWSAAGEISAPKGKLVPQIVPGEQVTEYIKPLSITEPKPGVYVYDLGVHIAGFARFIASGKAGDKVTLDFDELINADGSISVKSHSSHTFGRYQVGELILSGKGRDVFEPRFTYHGFRYIQVRGLSSPPSINDLVGCKVHNKLISAGSFESGNELINKVQYAYVNSMLNSMHGVQTEPAREKINWTQDAHNMMEGAIYNFEFRAFAAKWLDDIIDSQLPNGFVPSINPNGGWGLTDKNGKAPAYADPWWGGVIVEIPWMIYRYYGDTAVLRISYIPMKKFVDYLSSTVKDSYFIDWGIGDWLEVGAEKQAFPIRTPLIQTSTTAYYFYAKLLSEAAALLGYKDDEMKYGDLSRKIKTAFNDRFLNDSTGLYADDSQTSQVLPLYVGLAPENKSPLILQRLLENIKKRNGHISSGFVGYLFLLYSLTDLGYANTVYEMATKEDFPGWGYMVKDGGGNLWESWGGIAFNFSSLGGVGNWYYRALAGINPDREGPGFKKIVIEPHLVGDLKWVRAKYSCTYGTIRSEWKRAKGNLIFDVEIPVNTDATIRLPTEGMHRLLESGRIIKTVKEVRLVKEDDHMMVLKVGSGKYHFVVN